MNDEQLLAATADERRTLADMFATFTDAQWSTPSLCSGWTVREVAAHLLTPFRVSLPKMFLGMIAAKGDFNKLADKVARRDAKLPTAEVVSILRKNADSKFKPPGSGYDAPLTDNIMHGLDIRRPLGIERDIPADRLVAVLDGCMKPGPRKFFGNDLSGVTLSATDVGWTSGSGPTIEGKAEDMAMVLCGRTAGFDRLTGDGVAILQGRVKS
jgi:uncharacterized protein (TIGR03083 family)